jgi:hypothetical protein
MSETYDRMCNMYESALQTLNRTASQNESRYNLDKIPPEYSQGEQVLLFSPRVNLRESAKWTRFFSTEAIVVERLNMTLYRVQPKGSRKTILCHVDRLKKMPPSFEATRTE